MKILLVEDNPGDARLLREMFKEQVSHAAEVTHVETMAAAEAHVAAHAADVIVLDLGLPDAQGLAAVRRARATAPLVPLVVMTGYDNELLATQALQYGAQDYLVKGQIESRGLMRALRYAIERQAMESKLEQARYEAERANRAKSRFLAGMSHELRTPLNGILGYAQLLRLDGGLNAVQSTRLDAMLAAGTHLLALVQDVLDLSEIETDRPVAQLTGVDPRRVAQSCLDLVRPCADAKTLRVSLSVEAEIPLEVRADPKRLRQVLLNLLGNAVKFTADGSVTLGVRSADSGTVLRFEVKDTGIGIPAGEQHRLFQDFERLGGNSATPVEGAGLGLALSARLAALMGGRLGHTDNPPVGSIFWLEIPLVASEIAVPFAVAMQNGISDDKPPAAAGPLRVLVVDDIAMNRDIAASFLRSDGHEVICADSGLAAVEAVTASDFDVIMMDVRMPGMDGLEATRRIRALTGGRSRVPIVAVTAQVFIEQIEECSRAGMDSHLMKPFTVDMLLAAVRCHGQGASRFDKTSSLGAVWH